MATAEENRHLMPDSLTLRHLLPGSSIRRHLMLGLLFRRHLMPDSAFPERGLPRELFSARLCSGHCRCRTPSGPPRSGTRTPRPSSLSAAAPGSRPPDLPPNISWSPLQEENRTTRSSASIPSYLCPISKSPQYH